LENPSGPIADTHSDRVDRWLVVDLLESKAWVPRIPLKKTIGLSRLSAHVRRQSREQFAESPRRA
jgi:hypothetical protein